MVGYEFEVTGSCEQEMERKVSIDDQGKYLRKKQTGHGHRVLC
jgi:hypothetical protein